MQLQSIGFTPYSSNKSQKAGFGNPNFGRVRASCTEQARAFLGEDTASRVDAYALDWLKKFPAEYSVVFQRLADVIKILEVDVFRKAGKLVMTIADNEIPAGHATGQSSDDVVVEAAEEALDEVLYAWARARLELEKNPVKVLN